MENIAANIGLEPQPAIIGQRFRTYINLKLAAIGCPSLHALLHIMRDRNFEGRGLKDPAVRDLFDPEKALASDWYRVRLEKTEAGDQELWSRHVKNLGAPWPSRATRCGKGTTPRNPLAWLHRKPPRNYRNPADTGLSVFLNHFANHY
jgi:hypothetical protein